MLQQSRPTKAQCCTPSVERRWQDRPEEADRPACSCRLTAPKIIKSSQTVPAGPPGKSVGSNSLKAVTKSSSSSHITHSPTKSFCCFIISSIPPFIIYPLKKAASTALMATRRQKSSCCLPTPSSCQARRSAGEKNKINFSYSLTCSLRCLCVQTAGCRDGNSPFSQLCARPEGGTNMTQAWEEVRGKEGGIRKASTLQLPALHPAAAAARSSISPLKPDPVQP